MSQSSSDEINSFVLPTMHQQNTREGMAEKQLDRYLSSSSNASALQLHIIRKQREKQRMQVMASLLLVICLGCLGALSLAPALFPNAVHLIGATQPSSNPGDSISSKFDGSFKKSECTAQPADMKYLPGKASHNALPPAWFQAGYLLKDFAYAQACAASFVSAYQTFNANNPQTFETCVSMLTDGGKQRFYGSASKGQQPDKHMLPMWRASMQQQGVQQTARTSEPRLIAAQYKSARLIVWMLIPYRLSISVAGSSPVVENAQITVLLVAVPSDKKGTGWQVSQWQDGNVVFKPSALL